VDAELGLRERKKQRTRQLIADTARRLFAERGFDAVPVAEVARAAEVSEATVFNYFPTKEALVYQGMEAFEANLLQALRDRPPAEPLVAAFRRFVLDLRGLFASDDPEALEAVTAINRTIAASPALLAHEREIFARYTDSLALLIADETNASPGDIRPRVVANALIGVHRSLVDYTRRHLIEGTTDRRRLARNVRKQGQLALTALEEGLADYAPKRTSAPDAADSA
jgi:AcrR family transcriptional regulator